VVVTAPAPRNNVNDRARAPAVRRRKCIGEHRHLIHCHQRDIGEDSLATPHIDTVCAVDLEPCLPAACAVGGDENFIHEDVTLVDSRAVGGVEQRQASDATGQERCLLHLLGREIDPKLRLVNPKTSGCALNGDNGRFAGDLQCKRDGGAAPGRKLDVRALRSSEAVLGDADRVGTGDGQAGRPV
jgi:hypothetical protein